MPAASTPAQLAAIAERFGANAEEHAARVAQHIHEDMDDFGFGAEVTAQTRAAVRSNLLTFVGVIRRLGTPETIQAPPEAIRYAHADKHARYRQSRRFAPASSNDEGRLGQAGSTFVVAPIELRFSRRQDGIGHRLGRVDRVIGILQRAGLTRGPDHASPADSCAKFPNKLEPYWNLDRSNGYSTKNEKTPSKRGFL